MFHGEDLHLSFPCHLTLEGLPDGDSLQVLRDDAMGLANGVDKALKVGHYPSMG
jgi:hypothetical protein